MGSEMTKMAKSAIRCPVNLIWTIFDLGFDYPKNVREVEQRRIKRSYFACLQKPRASDKLLTSRSHVSTCLTNGVER